MGKATKKTKKPKPKKDALRAMLEVIYWAATDGGYFMCDEEQLRLEDFRKVASTLERYVLPKDRGYLAGVDSAEYFSTVENLLAHLRCNLGPQWGMQSIPDVNEGE